MKKRILIVVAVGLAAIFIVALINRDRTNPAIEREREAIRALGYPATWDELHAHLAPEGDPENAAPIYAEAFELYDNSMVDMSLVRFLGDAPDPVPSEPMPEKVYIETGLLIESNARYFELLQAAAGIPFCKPAYAGPDTPPWEWDARLDAWSNARNAAHMLVVKTAHDLDRGDFAAAVADVDANLALSRLLYSDSMLVGGVVGLAVDSMAIKNIERILNHSDISIDQLESLLRRLDGYPDITNNLLGEVYSSLDPDMHNRWAFLPGSEQLLTPSFVDRLLGTTAQSEYPKYLRLLQAFLTTKDQPPEVYRDHPAVHELMREALIPTPYQTINSISDQTLSKIMGVHARHRAYLRLACTAIRITLHHIETGEFPDTLEEFALESVQDPMTGESLRYGHDDAKAWVYSVGKNGEDEGGWDFVNQEDFGDDIALVVWR